MSEFEFVPFKIAKKLKEKGFKEKCLTYYDVIDNVGLLYNTQYTNDLSPCQYTDLLQSHNTDVSAYQSDDSEYCVDAPTIPQVLNWLRVVLEIDIIPKITISWCGNLNRIRLYSCNIYSPRLNKPIETKYFESYEKPILECIDYALDNLI